MKNKMAFLLLLIAAVGYSQNWKTDFSQAATEAIAQNKPIILVFSGSDWCAPCIKLDKTIDNQKHSKNMQQQIISSRELISLNGNKINWQRN